MSTSPEPSATTRTYGGRSADDRRADRRDRLVAAAVSVLGQRGEGATTMTAICAEAGLTERYFYESFTNREAALVAALDAVSDHIAVVAVEAIEHTSGTSTDRVRAALTALATWVDDHPGDARVALVESTAHPALRARRRELLGTFADLVVTEAVELYGHSGRSPERARAHGLIYVAGLAELVTARMAGELTLSAEGLVEIGTDSFERLARTTQV